MKYLLAVFLFACLNGVAQPGRDSSVTVKYGIDTNDVQNIYSGLLDIDVQKYYVPGAFSEYHCDFIVEEYKEGRIVKRESFLDSLPGMATFAFGIERYLDQDRFPVLVYSQKRDTTLRLYLVIGGAGIHKKYPLLPKLRYSWKEVYDLESKKRPLKPGEAFPLAVYSSAIGTEQSQYGEGVAEFCRISGELVPPKDWYKELGIEHFYLFSIRLVKKPGPE